MQTTFLPKLNLEQNQQWHDLIEANSVRALWAFPQDYYPSDIDSVRRILERTSTRGDRATFMRARQLLNILLPS